MFSRRVIAMHASRQREIHAFSAIFWFWGKMGFLGHNFGCRHARRSIKSSIDADDHLVSNEIWAKNLAHWIGVEGQSKLVKNPKTPPLCELLPGEPQPQIKKCFFNRTKKTCRIRRGFEQLSSYSGWRVVAKKVPATTVAGR